MTNNQWWRKGGAPGAHWWRKGGARVAQRKKSPLDSGTGGSHIRCCATLAPPDVAPWRKLDSTNYMCYYY
jgi:hypothetical protein